MFFAPENFLGCAPQILNRHRRNRLCCSMQERFRLCNRSFN